jgi:hypothetical protein
VAHDLSQPAALAGRLIELKKLFGGSDCLALVSADAALPAETNERRKIDEAKQQMYLPLIKAGWTKDEIYAMVGVTPPRSGPMQMPPPPAPRFGGNLGKLGQ